MMKICFETTQCRFEFVRSVGTDILPISLPNGQEISGKVIKHVTGNGPIYLRALKPLKNSCSQVCVNFLCSMLIENNHTVRHRIRLYFL